MREEHGLLGGLFLGFLSLGYLSLGYRLLGLLRVAAFDFQLPIFNLEARYD